MARIALRIKKIQCLNRMKYLRIHKIIWALLVLLYTLVECVYISCCCILFALWNFKLISFNQLWRDFHSFEEFINTSDGDFMLKTFYLDDNVFDTLHRRYHFFES